MEVGPKHWREVGSRFGGRWEVESQNSNHMSTGTVYYTTK